MLPWLTSRKRSHHRQCWRKPPKLRLSYWMISISVSTNLHRRAAVVLNDCINLISVRVRVRATRASLHAYQLITKKEIIFSRSMLTFDFVGEFSSSIMHICTQVLAERRWLTKLVAVTLASLSILSRVLSICFILRDRFFLNPSRGNAWPDQIESNYFSSWEKCSSAHLQRLSIANLDRTQPNAVWWYSNHCDMVHRRC